MPPSPILADHPPLLLGNRLLWTALVDVGATEDLGPSPAGHRFIVPITGGSFWGADGIERLSGSVVPGGADRQLLRPDGVKQLEAIYEMRTDEGIILSIHNQVIVDTLRQPDRYAMSVIRVTAPDGPLAWLNRRLIVGTLQSLRPKQPAVVIRAYEMDAS